MDTNTLDIELTIILLAGGKSQRMGSDKGLLVYQDVSFVERLIAVSKSITKNVILSTAKENAAFYAHHEVPVITDERLNCGPLGGVVSSLSRVKTPWFMLLSVDAPLVDVTVIQTLWQSKSSHEAVVFESNNRMHPLIGLYQTNTSSKWENALITNELRITDVVESMDLFRIPANSMIAKAIVNINTPEEFSSLQNQTV